MAAVKRKRSLDVDDIPPPNFGQARAALVGTAPLVQLKFSAKAREQMIAAQVAGKSRARQKSPRDLDADFQHAVHRFPDGRCGIPATALKAAMVAACRLVNLEMTRAKMALFVEADGVDADDGTPLIRIEAHEPERHIMHVRNASGVADVRVRAMWREWTLRPRIIYDRSVLTSQQVANLLARAGIQVGIGEGRPFSKNSVGMGWGTFIVDAFEFD